MKGLTKLLILALITYAPAFPKNKSSQYSLLGFVYALSAPIGPVQTMRLERVYLSGKVDESRETQENDRDYIATFTYDKTGKIVIFDPPLGCSMKGARRKSTPISRGDGIVEKIIYDYDGSIYGRTSSLQDSQGRRLEYSEYGRDGQLQSKFDYRYDDGGKLIEEHIYNKSSLQRIEKYNEKGLVIELREYHSNLSQPAVLTFSYEYDSYGNWIKRIDSEVVENRGQQSLRPVTVYYRIITYYD